MSPGWSVDVSAITLGVWNRPSPEVKTFLLKALKPYEDKLWKTIRAATKQADNCNFGRQPCTMRKMLPLTVLSVVICQIHLWLRYF